MSDALDPLIKQLADRLIAEQEAMLAQAARREPLGLGSRVSDAALVHLAAALVPVIRAAAKDAVQDERGAA